MNNDNWLGPMADDHTWTLGDWTVKEREGNGYTVIDPGGWEVVTFVSLGDAKKYVENEK